MPTPKQAVKTANLVFPILRSQCKHNVSNRDLSHFLQFCKDRHFAICNHCELKDHEFFFQTRQRTPSDRGFFRLKPFFAHSTGIDGSH